WTTPDNRDITFTLIGIIEDSPVLLIAFGFDKGDAENNSGNDKRFSMFSDDDLEHLGTVVKNRINALKRSYALYHKEMTDTGHGLMEEDHEDEITEGSDLDLLVKNMEKKFPWYKRMHKLMGTSPVVDKSAIANSTTLAKNLDLLKRNKGARAAPASPKWDIEGDMSDSDSIKSDMSKSSSDSSGDESDNIKVPFTPSQPSKAPTSRVSTSLKRKGIEGMVADVGQAARDATVKVARIRFEEKTRGATKKEEIKCKSIVNIELARLEHARAESLAQRAHELAMLNRQIELERMRQSHLPAPSAPSAHIIPPHANHYSTGPPPSWNFNVMDPMLN
ncbi:hypothetical protein DXG01_008585, partial [Tephrocybe rancida]